MAEALSRSANKSPMTAPPHATGALPDNPANDAFQLFSTRGKERTQKSKADKRCSGGSKGTTQIKCNAEEIPNVKNLSRNM
jgi:hypothetical protein